MYKRYAEQEEPAPTQEDNYEDYRLVSGWDWSDALRTSPYSFQERCRSWAEYEAPCQGRLVTLNISSPTLRVVRALPAR